MAKTLKELAKEAYDVQDACNLSGVVFGFARAMESLCACLPNTSERNTHPIVILWIDKLNHLAGIQDIGNDRVMAAYKAVRKLMENCAHCGEYDCSSATCWRKD